MIIGHPLLLDHREEKKQFWNPSTAISAHRLAGIKAITAVKNGSKSSSSAAVDKADDEFRMAVTTVFFGKRVLD